MATVTAAPTAYHTRRFVLRVVLAIIALPIIAILGSALWFYSAARVALPNVDGTIRVSGLNAPVTVIRDAQGVPHLAAATLEDLFFAQGFVTAQDRLWQMDMTRRYAAGELAEVLGPKYLEHDRQQRTLLMRSVAENGVASLSARDRSYFEAYARGVNACIASQRHLPIEFRILRYRPRPWTITDSFLVAASMVQRLALETLPHQFARERIIAHLAPELAADLYPNSSWRDHPPVSAPGEDEFLPSPGESQPEEQQPEPPAHRARPKAPAHVHTHRHLTKSAAILVLPAHGAATAAVFDGSSTISSRDLDVLPPGSNNWVVSGAHTVSGKPLLSNDMHLAHQLPNIWYEAHLTSGDFDVAGVTLPGVPFVIVGHNRRIAWGFTNIAPAVFDVFVETFNERGEYLTPEGWRPAEHSRAVIHVHGQADETLDVVITRHGPVISRNEPGEARQVALKWTAYDPQALQMPFFDLNSAGNWQQFRQALQRFTNPAQNVVYGDVDGHIGYQAAGLIPIRAAGDASVPVSGADNSHEWNGYIPFESLPSVVDPPSGILGTANGRISPDSYPYLISNEWGPPYRTQRIYRVLGSDRKLTPTDMLVLQTDIYSDFDRYCGYRFVYAVDQVQNLSPRVREAAELMRNWDGRATTETAAATVIARSRRELTRLLLQPKIGDLWQDYRWFMSSVWLENILLHQPARWLPAEYVNWDSLLAAAVTAAVDEPDTPRNLAHWKWGMQQPLNIQHPVFGRIPLLHWFAGTGRVPQSGNGFTVKQVGSRFGPSERMTVDFSNLDGSTLNLVNGQSGQIFSPHFMDQWKAWYSGSTFVLPFSAGAVEKAQRHRLVLEPQ